MMNSKIIKSLVIAISFLVLFVGTAIAQEGNLLSFGIRPTKAYEDKPESFSYFSHVLEAGSVLEDEALVLNDGDLPVTLKLYAADGVTAQNGGTSFTAQGEYSHGGSRKVSDWLSVATEDVSLNGGDELTVPFTISVPADATPGHHVAGLVVEAPPNPSDAGSGEEEGAQFAVQIIHRVGVAVLIDVPGPREPGLEIDGARLVQQDEQGATFAVDLHNTGNIFLQPLGFLEIRTTEKEELSSLSIELDTILPGDKAIYNISYPIHLSDSDYILSITLIFAEGKTAQLDGVEMRVRNGQPEQEGDSEESALLPIINVLGPLPGQNGFLDQIGTPLLGIALFFGLVLIGFLIFKLVEDGKPKNP